MFDFSELTGYFDHHSAGGEAVPPESCQQESHAEREILLVLEGSMNFYLAGKRFAATPGRAFFMDGWVPHLLGYSRITDQVVHIWVHLHKNRLFAMSYILVRGSRLHSSDMWEFPDSMLELINIYWDRARRSSGALRDKLYGAITRMITGEISFQESGAEPTAGKEDDIISWVKNYISMNYGRNSSMAELERLTGFNRRHLMRKFKSETAMTVGEYINCVRRGFAAAAGKRLTQKEIAFQLGFKSPAAFWLWQKRDREKFFGNEPSGE